MAGGCWGNSKMAWVRNQMEPCGSSSGLTPLTEFFAMFLGGRVHADTDLSRTGGFSWHLMPMCACRCTEVDFNLTGGFSWHLMPMCAWGCSEARFNLTGGLFWHYMPISMTGGCRYVDLSGDGFQSLSEECEVISAVFPSVCIT